jgi:hypothetical protein
MMMFKIRGVNSDLDTCQCCGKTNLKKVVWLDRLEEGEVIETVAYGVNCAARAVRMGSAAVWSTAVRRDEVREREELSQIHKVGGERSVRALVIESISQNVAPAHYQRPLGNLNSKKSGRRVDGAREGS